MADTSGFSVLDMVDAYAKNNDINPDDIFKQADPASALPKEVPLPNTPPPTEPPPEIPNPNNPPPPQGMVKADPPQSTEKKGWMPDPSLLAGMPEFQSGHSGVAYDASEIIAERDTTLKNINDESAIQESRETMDDMSRKLANIEDAKRRHGIVKLKIPEGPVQVQILTAAGDSNYRRGQDALDAIFTDLIKNFPEVVLEWAPDVERPQMQGQPNFQQNTGKVMDFPEVKSNEGDEAPALEASAFGGSTPPKPSASTEPAAATVQDADTKIIIDKRNLPQIAWSQEEVDKIKKSRTVELNIVEAADIEFASIDRVKGSAVDAVLAPYIRKTNDNVGALPASKYRATFTGLSYPEVIDLSSSNDMNNLDGEYKKWSIAFNHVKNQSIGPWEDYVLYTDPNTNEEIRVETLSDVPAEIPDDNVHEVSKFEDFLRKTSFMDLEFILWKILCATAMDKEIISIDCHAKIGDGICNHNYDWIYSPSELLDMKSLSTTVLDEIKETAEANTKEEIMKIYGSAPVCSKNAVKLHTSGFYAVYGHVSAYDYLEKIYTVVNELDDENNTDPGRLSKGMAYTTLTCIKAFLVPTANGRLARIDDLDGLMKVINSMDEIDWQTISEITRLMISPYQFRFSMRDIVCPKCKNKSSIPIDNMSRLLFIVARSLSSVQVTLKKA